jgi:hypothetical protein
MNKTIKKAVYSILLLIFTSFCAFGSVEELVDSYDFSYYDGRINITAFNDFMVDTDTDSSNDTLVLNMTANVLQDGNYTSFYFLTPNK